MSFIPVMQYLAGIVVFGFFYWLFNGILDSFKEANIVVTGSTYNILLYLWTGILIIYLVFGGWWVVRKYNEKEYQGGF